MYGDRRRLRWPDLDPCAEVGHGGREYGKIFSKDLLEDMRILFLSDIHGVPAALDAALAAGAALGYDKIALLGDLLYHGPRNGVPNYRRGARQLRRGSRSDDGQVPDHRRLPGA